MNLNLLPSTRVLLTLGMGLLGGGAYAPGEATAQPPQIVSSPQFLEVACPPTGSFRIAIKNGVNGDLRSLGVSPQDPNYCRFETKDMFIVDLDPPDEGAAEAAVKMRDVISGRVAQADFYLTWFQSGILKSHEVWQNLGLKQTEDGRTELTIRRNVQMVFGKRQSASLDITLPVINGTAYLMNVGQKLPDPSNNPFNWPHMEGDVF